MSGGLAPGRGLERVGARRHHHRLRNERPGALPPDEDWNAGSITVTGSVDGVRGPCPRTRIGTSEATRLVAFETVGVRGPCPRTRIGTPVLVCRPSDLPASGGLAPGPGLERRGGSPHDRPQLASGGLAPGRGLERRDRYRHRTRRSRASAGLAPGRGLEQHLHNYGGWFARRVRGPCPPRPHLPPHQRRIVKRKKEAPKRLLLCFDFELAD